MVATAEIPTRPERHGVEPLSDLVQSDWTVARTRQALRDHMAGQFTDSAMLVDAVVGDERVAADLRTRSLAVLGCPFSLDASPEGDRRRAESVAKELRRSWKRLFPASTLAGLLRWSVTMGFGLASVGWTASSSSWEPDLTLWHPQHTNWDDMAKAFEAQSKSGPVRVAPGAGAWLLHAPSGARPWADAAVRGVAVPWLFRQHARRDWARYTEKHLFAVTAGTLPTGTSKPEKDAFLADLRRLGSEGVVLLPKSADGSGFDLRFIEPANSEAWKAAEGALYHCDVSIAVAFLGQASNAQEGGSYAKATALNTIRQDLLEADAAALAETIRDQVLRPWALWNFGDADLAPVPRWDTRPPEDAKRAAEVAASYAQSLPAWQSLAATQGLEVDVDALARAVGMPLRPATKPAAKPAPSLHLHRLAGAPGAGAAEGQAYVDDVFAAAIERAGGALREGALGAVLAAIDAAESYDGLREALAAILVDVDDAAAQELLTGAVLCCVAAGVFSARGDAGGGG